MQIDDSFTDPPLAREDIRAANRRVAFRLLLIMAGVAALGLAFALYTVPKRRANDHLPKPTIEKKAVPNSR